MKMKGLAEVCYTFVTLVEDVLKSPLLSYFLRNKFIQVPSSALFLPENKAFSVGGTKGNQM